MSKPRVTTTKEEFAERQQRQANDRQVGGDHYSGDIQHWDWAAAQGLDYFQGCITGYVARCWRKNGIEDLEKAQHFLEKYIELAREGKLPSVNV